MNETLIFITVSSIIILISFFVVFFVVVSKKIKHNKMFPVLISEYNVRCTHSQFKSDEIKNQIMFLKNEWPKHIDVEFNPSGVFIDFNQEESFVDVSPEYDYINKTLRIPCRGAEHIWQTGLAHELAHYVIDPDMILYRKMGESHPFFDIIFSEKNGCVRRARVAMGMHPYPGMKMPEFYL